jgi:hypothetical protein
MIADELYEQIADRYPGRDVKIEVSEDNLTMKWKFQWQDEPALITVWNQDRFINSWRASRDIYALNNGITKKPTKVSYFDKELNEEVEFIWEVPSIPSPSN